MSWKLIRSADLLLSPIVYLAASLLKVIRRAGIRRMPHCRSTLMRAGVFPLHRHYYDPQFDHRTPDPDFSADRALPGIDWNADGQLQFLESFTFGDELSSIPSSRPDPLRFHFANGAFESGDAEYWYQLIRTIKPRRIIEIGSGYSTLMAIEGIARNRADDRDYACDHVCVEPYEAPWLESLGVTVIRQRVEDLAVNYFARLRDGDILFIDSSHMIRPQGDVLFEFLELLPTLRPGVIVHIHDIFSPKNYLRPWLQDDVRFWNEQYLLEAFLSHNGSWQIIGALNWLHHHHYAQLKSIAPHLTPAREPGSFYIRKK